MVIVYVWFVVSQKWLLSMGEWFSGARILLFMFLPSPSWLILTPLLGYDGKMGVFDRLDEETEEGPSRSVEGWVIIAAGVHEEAQVHEVLFPATAALDSPNWVEFLSFVYQASVSNTIFPGGNPQVKVPKRKLPGGIPRRRLPTKSSQTKVPKRTSPSYLPKRKFAS